MTPWYQKRVYIIAGFILLSVITGLATYGIYKATHPAGGTVNTSNDTTEQRESAGVNPALPSETNFTLLLDQGITAQDLATFQSGISSFFVSNTTTFPPSSDVVLSNVACHPPDDNDDVICSYTLTVNKGSVLNGTLTTDTTGPVSIALVDSSGKQLLKKTFQPASS